MMTTLPVVFLACADSFVFKRWMHAQPRCESTKHACLPGCHKFVCTWVCDPWAFYESRWLKAKAHVVIVKTDFTATTLKSYTSTSHIPNPFTRPLYVSSLHLRGVKLSQNFYSCTRGAQADEWQQALCGADTAQAVSKWLFWWLHIAHTELHTVEATDLASTHTSHCLHELRTQNGNDSVYAAHMACSPYGMHASETIGREWCTDHMRS